MSLQNSVRSSRRLVCRILAAVLFSSGLFVMNGTSQAVTPLDTELLQVMEASAAAWTAGKLDDFMTVYENTPQTTYVSGGKVVKGYAAIRAMYAERFGSASAPGQLGALTLDVLETRPLGADYALFIGRYHLLPAPGKQEYTGLFTLVFHRAGGQWHIVNDHSS